MIATSTSVHVPVNGRMVRADRPQAPKFRRCPACSTSGPDSHVAGSDECETYRQLRLESIRADD